MIGIFKTSRKENEHRIPIYPAHIGKIPSHVLSQMRFEEGYGEDFGYDTDRLTMLGCKFLKRDELFRECDVLVLPKPVALDLQQMRNGQTLFGWTHAVQQKDIADLAIEKKLTLVAWEEMHHYSSAGKMHIFYRNNELAGYAGILHFLQLTGSDGHYGERKKVVVLGFGAVSKGAIYALQGRGFNNIIVYTQRPSHLVADKNPDVWYKNFAEDDLHADLCSADLIFNGVLQDVNQPMMFIANQSQLSDLKDDVSIVDISCDKGMGFFFATPTTFTDPTFRVERMITYYSVDHTPTYLWNAASREISVAVLPFLQDLCSPEQIRANPLLKRAIDIDQGNIINPNIIKFQGR